MTWQTKPSRTGNGQRYGPAHRKARAAAARRHHPTDPCSRCGHPLGPMTRYLHYDHDETGGYLGFSHGTAPCPTCHRRCNLSAGSYKAIARQQPRPRRAQSRNW